MSQKGGVGKSSLTNSVILDWSFKELLKTKKMPKILLIDADAQASISALRKRDIELCKMNMEGKEFLSLDATVQTAVKEMRTQFEALFTLRKWSYYSIFSLDTSDDGTSLSRAISFIENGEFDYVFVDMPGTLHQKHTMDLFLFINYLIVPMQIGNYDVQSALDFCKLLSSSAFEELKCVRLMFNKYELIKAAKYDEVERDMVVSTKFPFFKTRVKLSAFYSSKGYNSIVPPTFRVNLNTLAVAESKATNIGEFSDELRKMLHEN
jgi:cellulose biosynthesis protein BcsQ